MDDRDVVDVVVAAGENLGKVVVFDDTGVGGFEEIADSEEFFTAIGDESSRNLHPRDGVVERSLVDDLRRVIGGDGLRDERIDVVGLLGHQDVPSGVGDAVCCEEGANGGDGRGGVFGKAYKERNAVGGATKERCFQLCLQILAVGVF